MVVTHDFDKLSKYENIFHPQKEDYLTCIDDESSSGETVDDGVQGTDVGGLIKISSGYIQTDYPTGWGAGLVSPLYLFHSSMNLLNRLKSSEL